MSVRSCKSFNGTLLAHNRTAAGRQARRGPVQTVCLRSAQGSRSSKTRSQPLPLKAAGKRQQANVAVVSPLEAPPAPQERVDKKSRKKVEPIKLKIDDQWYNVGPWASNHPGGVQFLQLMDGHDATNVFYALHSYGPNGSEKALKILNKLPKCAPPEGETLASERDFGLKGAETSKESFQEFRKRLEEEGWFNRSVLQEARFLGVVVGLFGAGTVAAWNGWDLAAIVALGLGSTQAGWLGHDYIHGRGKWCEAMRPLGSLFNGHSGMWWTTKHSLHHSFTNDEKHDGDVMMEPFFFLRPPAESGRDDSLARKFQHFYMYPLLSSTFLFWRVESLRTVYNGLQDGESWAKEEAGFLALNYLWMLSLGPGVALSHVLLAGFIVGGLVTATHQSEEIYGSDGERREFIDAQFSGTRDAICEFGPLEEWIWGGMDTQLEHHLFPSMPRYKYHKLRPLVKEWAESNGCDFRASPSTKILKDNFSTLKDVALHELLSDLQKPH
mmetsp:Transcript_26594/g.32266  ORF Transcript_26594/g.32266 Transcript_26594/m.32266 type:complete len:497 (-) Transcript_26594:540-2030(-)|eukprot:CAMPEP_0197851960 /NCGR_PEP_ID=MMETSP1438-20131217/19305_1 /TAXON_ID=1461541 /ORGANISM="Pterosperma sp., Strain CCMP1384" /LENGTH=496 /DNA_ID=CAMNT_0043465771 /DNA_START=389 /DNA_END=1879 /DNA_ORIENTATION=+